MSTPTFKRAGLASLFLLAACGKAPSGEPAGNGASMSRSPVEAIKTWVDDVADDRPRIFCAIGEGASLAQDCRFETIEDAESRVLILFRPDGGFRRLRVGGDGALRAADGALEARTARNGAVIGVLFGDERYAVPASALGSAAAP
jgi:hypothetical protein